MAEKKPLDLSALVASKEAKVQKATTPKAKTKKPTTTKAMKIAAFRVKVDAKKQFGILAKELDMLEQDLIAEAMNMVFEKYGKDPIA